MPTDIYYSSGNLILSIKINNAVGFCQLLQFLDAIDNN